MSDFKVENNSFKIKDVISLVPVQIKYEMDGLNETIFGYIDYSTYDVYVDVPQNISLEDFRTAVVDFLLNWEQQAMKQLENKVPQEAYQQANKKSEFNIKDYLPKNMPSCASIRLKESNGKA